MGTHEIHALRAFVPARDYEAGLAFYQEIGFELAWRSDEVSLLRNGDFGFLLQNFFVPTFGENFMMQLIVEDLDEWWARLAALDLPARYPDVQIKPPADYPWGLREIHLKDPSGVLWHVVQGRRSEDAG